MKARVTVTLKSGVLDPQGLAITGSLRSLGFEGINSVRQGKVFDLDMGEADPVSARAFLTSMCERLLANTVIENYAIDVISAPAVAGVWPARPAPAAAVTEPEPVVEPAPEVLAPEAPEPPLMIDRPALEIEEPINDTTTIPPAGPEPEVSEPIYAAVKTEPKLVLDGLPEPVFSEPTAEASVDPDVPTEPDVAAGALVPAEVREANAPEPTPVEASGAEIAAPEASAPEPMLKAEPAVAGLVQDDPGLSTAEAAEIVDQDDPTHGDVEVEELVAEVASVPEAAPKPGPPGLLSSDLFQGFALAIEQAISRGTAPSSTEAAKPASEEVHPDAAKSATKKPQP